MQAKKRKLTLAIKDQRIDDAVLTYFELVKDGSKQKEIAHNIVTDVIPILYRTKYFHVPHGLMGLMAAIDLSEILDSYKELPLLQAIAYLVNENKLAPLGFSVYTPLYLDAEDIFQPLETFINEGDVAKAYRYFLSLLANNHINNNFHSKLFEFAMKDTFNVGHKAIYYHKILELIEYFEEEPPNIYYPSISYLSSEPKDFSVYEMALKEYKIFLSLKINTENNTRNMSVEDSNNLIDLIISSMKSRVLTYITRHLENGTSIKSLSDNIILAASQLILDTETDEWIKPIHAFNYSYALNWWIRNFDNNDKVLALYLQASLINQFSIEHKKVHFMANSVFFKNQNILYNLSKAIQTNNVSNAVALCQSYILSSYDIGVLIKHMAFLACQNSSIKNFTHDMKFASSSIKEYNLNSSPNKWLILVALAKHLSQSPKNFEIFKTYEKEFDV